MDKPRLVTNARRAADRADDSAKDFRRAAARKLQCVVHKQVTARNPLLSNEDALELIDALTLATIKGIEQYLIQRTPQ